MKRIIPFLWIALGLLCITGTIASAATVTQSMTYQGKLTDAGGNPLTGTYSVTFRLYDASTGGTALSTDTHSVTAANGLFTTAIAVTDPAVVDGRALWLGIRVGTDAEMTLRQEIRPVPYALSLRPGAWITGNDVLPVINVMGKGGGRALNVSTTADGSDGVLVYTTGDYSDGIGVMTQGDSSSGLAADTYGSYSHGVIGDTHGSHSSGVFAIARGSDSKAVNAINYADSSIGISAYTIGTSSPGIVTNTYGQSSPGADIFTNGIASNGLNVTTHGPVSYGLALKTTGESGYGIVVRTSGDSSGAIDASTAGDYSHGLVTRTNGFHSNGLSIGTSGDESEGIFVRTSGGDSPGADIFTTGSFSRGLNVTTHNLASPGIFATTTGTNSDGAHISTSGSGSHGFRSHTQGTRSYGVYSYTTGPDSSGVLVDTSGDDSEGVEVSTHGAGSIGVKSYSAQATGVKGKTASTDQWVPAVYGENTGAGDGVYGSGGRYGVYGYSPNSYGVYGQGVSSAGVRGQSSTAAGVYGRSENEYGIYAVTDRADDKYGIYTPDYLYAKGTQVPAADVAEYMPVSEDVEPGTVMVLGPDGNLQISRSAYDTGVAGIVSTSPGVTLGTRGEGNPGEEMIAVAGRVPCKVDASYGAIHPRDLLTTSDTPGYAMKAEPVVIDGRTFYPGGTILAKAMGTLESGTGVIEVLVTLQ